MQSGSNPRVRLTGRTGLVAADGARPLRLDLLTTAEARVLVARQLGAGRVAAEPEAVEQIVDACARLPLALAVATARAQYTGFPLATLADELHRASDRLDKLDTGEPASQVRAVFSWSYTALTPPTARLFRLLGLHPAPDISAPAVASLTAQPIPDTRRLLTELVRANLLTEHRPGRYNFHDLLRAYATDLARRHDSTDQNQAATHRLLDHYLHTAHAAAVALDPTRELSPPGEPAPGVVPESVPKQAQALAWFTAEREVLRQAIAHAAATEWDAYAFQLPLTVSDFLERQGHWSEWLAVLHTALQAATRLRDAQKQARVHRSLARVNTQMGHLETATDHPGPRALPRSR